MLVVRHVCILILLLTVHVQHDNIHINGHDSSLNVKEKQERRKLLNHTMIAGEEEYIFVLFISYNVSLGDGK
jgi:hypothetical protein